ncbi:hypothetical protein G6F62_013936 [Rhizopus arrhizus]|nr:hypothetical protein G6F62_013936 [Rhizopus arrhizus]
MATGSVSGLAIAAALAMGRPRRRSKGTVITLPPTPRKVAMAPMATPPPTTTPCPKGCGACVSCCCARKPWRSRQSRIVTPR